MSSVEYQTYMKKQKRSFILIVTIFLVISFSIYSLTIIENSTIASNLNKLKYLHLQATIHMSYIKNLLSSSDNINIDNVVLNDNRYELSIKEIIDINKTNYYISIKTKDDTPIRLSELIVK